MRILLIISFLCSVHFSNAQDRDLVREMTDNDFQIRQIPGSEQRLKELLQEVDTENDTIYAAMYSPTMCLRCEAYIPNFHNNLKSIDSKKTTLLITVYKDKATAERYNKNNGHIADHYIYDTGFKYKGIFSFNMHDLQGTYILKLKRSTGEMLTGGDPTEISPNFAKQIIAYQGKLECKTFDIETDAATHKLVTTATSKSRKARLKFKEYPIDTDDQPISSIYGLPAFENDNLLFNDNLENGILHYKLDNNRFASPEIIKPDSIEKRAFIEIPEENYRHLKNTRQVFYIPLSPAILDSERIGISYSLPHIFLDSINIPGQKNYSYINSPAILIRNAQTGEKEKIFAPDFELFTDSFFYKHFTFCKFKDYILYPCQEQTWPLQYSREEYENDFSKNPFDARYYDSQKPYFAAFSLKDGKMKHRFGNLEPCNKKSFTGYYYNSPVACATDEDLFYTDGYSGYIYVTKDIYGEPYKKYTAFEIDTGNFPEPDTTLFHSYDILKIYNMTFRKTVESMKTDGKYIYCLIKYSDPDMDNSLAECDHSVIKINRKTGKATETYIPRYPDMEALAYGLRNNNGAISPFAIYRKKDDTCYVRVFK